MQWSILQVDQASTRTEEKINSFGLLPIGWRYGQGGPIARNVLDASNELFRLLLSLSLLKTDAFPGVDGEVLLTAYHDDHYIVITINPDGTFHLRHEEDAAEHKDDEYFSVAEVKVELRQSTRIIWPTFDLSTSGNSTTHVADSAIWRSRRLQAA